MLSVGWGSEKVSAVSKLHKMQSKPVKILRLGTKA